MSNFEKGLVKRKEAEAQTAFAGYVQSVAFHMTLSRNMIDLLCVVRDWGHGTEIWNDSRGFHHMKHPLSTGHVSSHSVPLMDALKRRGLVYHNPFNKGMGREPAHWRWFVLTRAGELTCQLLVEANLIPAKMEKRPRRRA